MNSKFEYKGYYGSAEVSTEDKLLVGRLLFIRDVVSYVASTAKELEEAFHAAVDDYLATCQEIGDQPDVPFKGSFNVRVGPDLHRSAALAADRDNTSLNDWVCQAIDDKLADTHHAVNNLTVHIYGKEHTQYTKTTERGKPEWDDITTSSAPPVFH